MPTPPPVLFVSTYPPERWDLGGGSWVDRRIAAALRSTGADVDHIHVSPAGAPTDARSRGDLALSVRDKGSLARIAARMLVSRRPYLSIKWERQAGWPAAVAFLRERAAGRVVVLSGWPPLLLAAAAGVEVDAYIAQNAEWLIAAEHSPLPLRALRETGRLRVLEVELMRGCRHVFALSRLDAELFNSVQVSTSWLPMPLHHTAREELPRTVGLIGSASWPPNARAIEVLLDQVMPALRARSEAAPAVLLAGNGTQRWAGQPGVLRAGPVDDDAEFFRDLGLLLLPRYGTTTGVSVKLMAASENDVQSVAPASVGAALSPDPPWLAADSVDDMAAQVGAFFDAPDLGPLRHYCAGATEAATMAVLAPALSH